MFRCTNYVGSCAVTVTLLLCTVLPGVPVWAHEDEEIDEVLVQAGRWQNTLGYLTSASEGVVGQSELDARPRLRTGEILEVVPGLIVTQHSGSGKSNQMFLRGFNLDHGTDFATWIDGMPVNFPTHGHGQGYTDLNFIIPDLIRTVEFRKGPYYAEVSDFSSAGAAYLTTFSKLEEGFVEAGLGEDGYGRLLAADSIALGGGDLLYGVQTHLYDGPWVGVDEDLRRNNALVRYTRSTEAREWHVSFMGYDAKWDAADQVPLRAVQDGRVSELGTIDDTVGGDSSRYSLSGAWHADMNGDGLRARGYWINYELDLFSNFTYFLDDPVNGDQFEQVDERNVFGGDLSWTRRGEAGRKHTVSLALRHDDIDEVGLYRTASRERLSTVRRDAVRQTSAGLFYDLDIEWSDRWRGSFGARADYYRFDVRESTLAANTGTESDLLVTPKLNIVYAPTESTEWFLSAGQAFHSNDARGTVITIDPVSGEPAESVDPLVKSEGAEIGWRFFRDQTINVSASLWYLALDSELLFVGDAGNTEASRPSRRYGIEVPVYYRPNEIWTFDLELALSEGRFRGDSPDGDDIPGTLDRVISAGAFAQWPSGWYASARLRHFGERPLIEDNSVRSDPSIVINMSAGFRRERLDLRLDVLNVFDETDDDITYFYTSRLPGEPAEGIDDLHFHPMEPRTVRATLTWRY